MKVQGVDIEDKIIYVAMTVKELRVYAKEKGLKLNNSVLKNSFSDKGTLSVNLFNQ